MDELKGVFTWREEDPRITLGHRKPTQIVWLFLPEMLCIVILAAGNDELYRLGFAEFSSLVSLLYAQVNVQCKTLQITIIRHFQLQERHCTNSCRVPASDVMGMSMLAFILPGLKDNHTVSKTLAQSNDEQSRRIMDLLSRLLNRLIKMWCPRI